MYRIVDDRASGKTSRLMLIAKENNADFVCSNPHAMTTKAHAYGIVGINFISYYDYLHSMRSEEQRPVVIDELEMFLKYMVAYNGGKSELIGYTLNTGD